MLSSGKLELRFPPTHRTKKLKSGLRITSINCRLVCQIDSPVVINWEWLIGQTNVSIYTKQCRGRKARQQQATKKMHRKIRHVEDMCLLVRLGIIEESFTSPQHCFPEGLPLYYDTGWCWLQWLFLGTYRHKQKEKKRLPIDVYKVAVGKSKLFPKIQKISRHRQDSNLRGMNPTDFESVALTARPRCHIQENYLSKYLITRKSRSVKLL